MYAIYELHSLDNLEHCYSLYDIKENFYGLRGIQNICWIICGLYNIRQIHVNDILNQAVQKNIIKKREGKSLIDAYEFLLMLRNDLHYSHIRRYNMFDEKEAEKKSKSYSKQYYLHLVYLKKHFRETEKTISIIAKRIKEKMNEEVDGKQISKGTSGTLNK